MPSKVNGGSSGSTNAKLQFWADIKESALAFGEGLLGGDELERTIDTTGPTLGARPLERSFNQALMRF